MTSELASSHDTDADRPQVEQSCVCEAILLCQSLSHSCRSVSLIHSQLLSHLNIVNALIEAGSQIQAGSLIEAGWFNSDVLIEAGSPIEAGVSSISRVSN